MADYVRRLDDAAFDGGRFSVQTLADRASGSQHCRFNIAQVPPGDHGPDLHVHPFDQFYFILSGTMKLQIGEEEYEAGPNSLVLLPAGVPHRNWNEGPEVERHIALLVPQPAEGERASIPVTGTRGG